MSPILQSLANGSARGYGAFFGAGAAGAFESIATVTGNGSATSLTFSSIPGTYQHLQIRYIAGAAGVDRLFMQFNSDTGSNYASHNVQGDGSGIGTNVSAPSISSIRWAGTVMNSNNSSTVMGVGIIDIHDYASTSKYKTTRTLTGFDNNGSGNCAIASGLWMSTSAITSITLFPQNSPAWSSNTTFALYGIKGA